MDWLSEHPPNFMKRMREPSERKSKKKSQKLGEPSVSRPLVPLISSSSPSKSQPSDSHTLHLRQLSSSLPQPSPIYTHFEPTTSSTPSSPPYYNISSDSDQSEPSDPQSPTLAQLQAHAISTQNPSELETTIPSPSEHPTTPPSEPHTETPSENPVTQSSDPPTETIPTPPAPISPTFEPEPTFPTLEEAVALFAKSSMENIISLSENLESMMIPLQ
ncbi:extensin-like [Lathyrus oleraceus]|uniref:extensin-like n=1 Tax=Pisum sativum TaxID=3888 RepID=UPI0021D01B35|nr:extensin-like [Pisum sativum]